MNQRFVQMSLLVRDYDEAIEFYVKKLKFLLIEDTPLSETKRWVVVKPQGSGGASLLLAKAANPEQLNYVGNQAGGRVFLFLYTDNLERDLENLNLHNIPIVRGPVNEEYGKVVVFKDLYGNLWDLIEPSSKNPNIK
ncbi:VOC family protein [Litoribacter ruber]|uniref:VOC family protein n=1 Tax=Litoribacter ruber TaxID=702568 RepID=UPI001BD9F11E|nr:VOC family protein [Litoribacter ruber]MBT0812655.1 VOC family protein [Litoribacter ruber]